MDSARESIDATTQGEKNMSELTDDSLEDMLIKLRKHMDVTGDKFTMIPRYFIARPADLEALGLTVDEVTKMIKEQST